MCFLVVEDRGDEGLLLLRIMAWERVVDSLCDSEVQAGCIPYIEKMERVLGQASVCRNHCNILLSGHLERCWRTVHKDHCDKS